AVGIPISENIFPLYRFWLGSRLAYQALMEGRLFSGSEALEVGLIDALCPLEKLLPTAEQKMQSILNANHGILQNAKFQMRKQLIRAVDVDLNDDIRKRALMWTQPETRAMIGSIVDRLTKKSTA
ncbi:MAG: enoyl-CoA delta isomerase 1, partial [Saprospiraceae bacterium]|nr:enoyl-CoA delta isomerase 1 [Saprospiraceae bacterium]